MIPRSVIRLIFMSLAACFTPSSAPAEVIMARFEGERYEARVPDTLDLAERAAVALNNLTRDPYAVPEGPNSADNWAPLAYLDCTPKFVESIPLMRIMSGSGLNLDADRKFMESWIAGTAEDGLTYAWAIKGKPYGRPPLGTAGKTPDQFQIASLFGEARMIMALCNWYQHDHNTKWKEMAQRKIDKLAQFAAREGDTLYLTGWWASKGAYAPMTGKPANTWLALPQAAMIYYRLTGYEPARELAQGMARRIWKYEDWYQHDGIGRHNHLHSSTIGVMDTLECALLTGDREIIEFTKNNFEYWKSVGEPTIGFFPESAPGSKRWREIEIPAHYHEGCNLADMLVIGLKLARAGEGDGYWEDVDRWVRNQFVETQFTKADWVERVPPAMRPKDLTREFAERSIGSWAGSAAGNDLIVVPEPWMKKDEALKEVSSQWQCCTGNSARTLFYVWDSILTRRDDGSVRVNLLLNRASPWLDVDSYLPYEGKVELKIKNAPRVAVRLPASTDAKTVICKVNGKKRRFIAQGNEISIKRLKPGDHLTIQFPIKTRTVFKLIGDQPSKLMLRGNTVIDIEPRGTVCPTYQRRNYWENKAPMKTITRFVSHEAIQW